MDIWQPLRWFIQVFNLFIDVEFFPGLTFGTISLGLLAIALIFRMIVFPLTGGSASRAIKSSSDNRSFKNNRSETRRGNK